MNRRRVSQDRWLVSYADFITLLFAFFVVLYAFAKADQKKQQQVTASIDAAFHALSALPDTSRKPDPKATGTASQTMPPNIVMGEDVLSASRVKGDLGHLRRELEQTLSKQIGQHTILIQMGHDGLVISLREAGFFNSGLAVPRPETENTLRQIAASLARTPYDLRIEGHTDNIPIHNTEFDSNWELSSSRATHIARMFIDLETIPPQRISAAGYSQFHPVATNDTAAGRAENRRVDLVVLPRTSVDLSGPEPSSANGPWRKITDPD